MTWEGEVKDKLLSLSCRVCSSYVAIYNTIRDVGYGKLTADNALHQLVEQYHDLQHISDDIRNVVDIIEEEGGEK